jgi:type VI secretion system protein ImpF
MSSYKANKIRFQPTLLDRMFDDAPWLTGEAEPLRQWNVEELKASVARDLEAMLNSRAGRTAEHVQSFPNVAHSLVTFGMCDFVGRSLANPVDRSYICRTIETAINTHEPRLQGVRVSLMADTISVGRLHFSISAMLVVRPAQEPVSFDALLQPTTQQYSIAPARNVHALTALGSA